MYNHSALINLKAMINNDTETLGTITNSFNEGHLHCLVIDDDYELVVQSVEIVIDLINCTNFARLKGY